MIAEWHLALLSFSALQVGMQQQPMGQMRGRHTPIRIQTSSRFSGSQGMTPQQQAMAMFMRNTRF